MITRKKIAIIILLAGVAIAMRLYLWLASTSPLTNSSLLAGLYFEYLDRSGDCLYIIYYLMRFGAWVPLICGLVIAWRVRHCEVTPIGPHAILAGIALGYAFLLFITPGFALGFSLPLVAGCVISGVLTCAFLLRRYRKLSLARSLIVSWLVVLPVLVWTDLRFCVVVRDSNGHAVEVSDGDIDLRHPQESYLGNYVTGKGYRLSRGLVYFGFFEWLVYKGRWTFSGGFGDPGGTYFGDLEWKPAKWSEWPKFIVVRKPK